MSYMELSIPGIPCVTASLCVGITAQFYKLVTLQCFSFTLEILLRLLIEITIYILDSNLVN